MAVERARVLHPNVVIMDIHMPGTGGLQATSVLRAELPEIRVLMYTVSGSETDLFTAMRYGARGYLLKNSSSQELAAAVLHVAQAGVIVSPVMATKLLIELAHTPPGPSAPEAQAPGLKPRDVDVLKLLAKGAADDEIAKALGISQFEVTSHLENIMNTLHLTSRSEAAAYAWKTGLQRPLEA